jgi:hypothetical protein
MSAIHAIRLSVVSVCVLAFSGATALVSAQSLADVAKKEEERRKAVGEPAKVYTNKDLHAVPPGSVPSPAAEKAPGDEAKEPEGDAKGKAGKADEKEPVKDQAYWAGKQKALLNQLEQDQSYATAMQTRINALTTDFTNRDDPVQRAQIERDRQKALADLDRLTKAILADQKAIAAFQEDARRAGIPPGWLR